MTFLYIPGYRYPATLDEPIICGDLRYSFNLSRALSRKGHTVLILSRWQKGDAMESILDDVQIHRYKSELGRLLSTSFDISINRARLFKKLLKKSDAIICHSPLSLELSQIINKPLIYVCSGLEDIRNYSWSFEETVARLAIKVLREPLKHSTWRRAQHVNTTAEKENYILLRRGVPKNRIETISSGIEPKRYFPHPLDTLQQIRDTLGISTDDQLIISTSRFTPAKGICETLEGFNKLRAVKDNIKLLIIGIHHSHNNRYFKTIQNKIAALGIAQHVIVKENIPEEDLPKYYSLADVSSVFSIGYDPLPTTIIESMACGVPVISTYYKTREQFITNGVNGIFVEENNISDWTQGAIKLLDDLPFREQIIHNGLETIRLKFNMDHIADQYLELLKFYE